MSKGKNNHYSLTKNFAFIAALKEMEIDHLSCHSFTDCFIIAEGL